MLQFKRELDYELLKPLFKDGQKYGEAIVGVQGASIAHRINIYKAF